MTVDVSESQMLALEDKEVFDFGTMLPDCLRRVCSSSTSEKFDDVNFLRKVTKFTFLCFFTNK